MTSNPTQLLLVDDDADLRQLLTAYLQGEGFVVSGADSGEQALARLSGGATFDAMVLDIMMPGLNGLEVLQQLRRFCHMPVIMLTGRGDDIDRIIGLEMGADDYLAKPCNPRELSARLKAVLRRTQTSASEPPPAPVELADLRLDPQSLSASVKGQPLALTGAEFRTLQLLVEHAGQLLSKEQLTEQVLQRKLSRYDRSMDVHISRVRQKLQAAGAQQTIKAVRGLGYQLIADDHVH